MKVDNQHGQPSWTDAFQTGCTVVWHPQFNATADKDCEGATGGINHLVHDLPFEPISLGWKTTASQVAYLQKLYGRTVPVISTIFPHDHCLVWCGALTPDGYGRHKPPAGELQGSTVVSRYIYERVEDIPKDWTVDHACGNTACINLRHLRLLPRALNAMLGDHRKLNQI